MTNLNNENRPTNNFYHNVEYNTLKDSGDRALSLMRRPCYISTVISGKICRYIYNDLRILKANPS